MHPHNDGFTLVEVVVALALTTVLLSTVYAGFWIGIDGTRRVSTVIERNHGDRIITHFLRRQLRHVEIHGVDDATRFEGAENTLRFSVRHLQDDVSLRTLRLHADQDAGNRLLLEIEQPGSDDSAPALREVLITKLEAFGFEYFGSPDPDDEPPQWRRRWEFHHVPRLVRLSYRRADTPDRVLYLSVAGRDANQ